MTKTCEGLDTGLASGEALVDGVVSMAVGCGVGLACTWAARGVQAAISTSAMRLPARRWEMEIRREREQRITSLRFEGDELLDQRNGVDQPTAAGLGELGACD